MTPLAHAILKDYAENENKFVILSADGKKMVFDAKKEKSLVNGIVNSVCFECSDVADLAYEMTLKQITESRNEAGERGFALAPASSAFLPHQQTWVEFRAGFLAQKTRIGALFYGMEMPEYSGLPCAAVFLILKRPDFFGLFGSFALPLYSEANANITFDVSKFLQGGPLDEYIISFCAQVYAFLAFINSPRIVGRAENKPHRGLERSLKRSQIIPANSGLRPWTEIKLDIMPPAENAGQNAAERLTGKKALHFCRSFLRIRNGKLERVRSHWRGDASLGVVRSTYKLRA